MVDEQYMERLIVEDRKMTNWKKSHKSEGWKIRRFIKGYQRKYMICRNGLVYNRETKRWLKPQVHRNGYLYVCLYLEGKKKNVYLHRLIAEYFVPNRKGLDTVYHVDGDKTNNRVSNINRTSKSLLQRDLDPDNLPMLAKAIQKKRKQSTKGVRRISTRVHYRLREMAMELRNLPKGSQEREDLLFLIKCFYEDAHNGIPIPM